MKNILITIILGCSVLLYGCNNKAARDKLQEFIDIWDLYFVHQSCGSSFALSLACKMIDLTGMDILSVAFVLELGFNLLYGGIFYFAIGLFVGFFLEKKTANTRADV